jgi:uncharacterized protein DUF1206
MYGVAGGRGGKDRSVAQNKLRKWGIKDHADHAVRHSSPWVGKLARLGYLAKGFVYLAIGFLALREALGVGGRTTDPSGAMKSIGSQAFGGVMLVLLPRASSVTRCGSWCRA